MKKLEELGISPAPWTNKLYTGAEWNSVWDACAGNILSGFYTEAVADARLIATAPEMYDEQYHDCVALRAIVTKLDEDAEVLNLRDILAEMADRMEAALAKAAGEEVAR